jgi:hypothetical protein
LVPEEVEPVLKKNMHRIQEFGWISFERKNSYNSRVSKSMI